MNGKDTTSPALTEQEMVRNVTRAEILMSAKGIFETSEMNVVASMLQSEEWIAICAAYKPELTFSLIKIE